MDAYLQAELYRAIEGADKLPARTAQSWISWARAQFTSAMTDPREEMKALEFIDGVVVEDLLGGLHWAAVARFSEGRKDRVFVVYGYCNSQDELRALVQALAQGFWDNPNHRIARTLVE